MIFKFLQENLSEITFKGLFFILLLASASLFGQQDAQYTQYMYNTVSVNPGYAGTRGQLSVAALHRSQWLGLDGAPTSQTLNLHTPIGYKGVGLGFSIINDKVGPTSETNFDIDFSYTIYTSSEGRLSLGLKASGNLLDVQFSDLNQFAPDSTLENDIDNQFSPNFGVGVYYHNEHFYAGLSIPRFLETSHFDTSSLSTAEEKINLYLITGYVWDVNSNLKFKPTLLTKVVEGAPLQVDVSANFMLNEKFILGVGYRLDAALSAMAGFNVADGFLIGLAYDREITELGNTSFNDGSFEVILRYDFLSSTGTQLKSPRFF